MRVKIEKSIAKGRVVPPTSKSMAHRLLISAALASESTEIVDITPCDDVLATLDCLSELGICSLLCGSIATVDGGDIRKARPKRPLNCRESGSTLRFMIPLALLSGNEVEFIGAPRLLERPMAAYRDICLEKGLKYEQTNEKITVKGPLSAGEYSLPGNVSSQFITGLLFALSVLDDDSRIRLTTEVESRSYIELTRGAMAEFGVYATWEDERTLYIKGGQKYSSGGRVFVERDYSGAAFPDAFNLLGGEVKLDGMNEKSLQGDRVYKEHYKAISEGFATIDISDCPDLGPILFTLAAACHGARFVGTKRLKIKESDRAAVMAKELSKFGAQVLVFENEVVVNKAELHTPGELLLGHNDHRIVMSLAVLASKFGGEIDGCEAVKKSYPSFFEHIKNLGIEFKTYEA